MPSEWFQNIKEIELEENRDVINVTPRLSFDDAGNFLVTDSREAQVRIYDADGTLSASFGRRGDGPGEFGRPMQTQRLSTGSLLVADISAAKGLMQFDPAGATFYGATYPAISPLYTATLLSDSIVLLAGRERTQDGESSGRLLHLWNFVGSHFERRFFQTPGDSLVRRVAINFGSVALALKADTIAAVFAVTDTLYLFTLSGVPVGQRALPFERFRRIESLPATNDPLERQRWLQEHDFIEAVMWLPSGTLLIQYERVEGMESAWNLLGVGSNGSRLFDLHNTPRLLANRGDTLYFIHPESETPNRWLLAQLRRH